MSNPFSQKFYCYIHHLTGTDDQAAFLALSSLMGYSTEAARLVQKNTGVLSYLDGETFRKVILDDDEVQHVKAVLGKYFHMTFPMEADATFSSGANPQSLEARIIRAARDELNRRAFIEKHPNSNFEGVVIRGSGGYSMFSKPFKLKPESINANNVAYPK